MRHPNKPLIVHVITRLIVGGAQLTVLETCNGLRDEFDFHVVCGPEEGSEGTVKERFKGVAPVTVLSHLRRDVHPVADVRALGALRRTIRHLEPEIVHTHSSKAGILARNAAAAEGRAAVHSIHGWGHTPDDGRFRRSLLTWLERRAAKQCQALIAVSRDVQEEGIRNGIGARELYEVIPECVDYTPLATDFRGARRSARRILGINGEVPVVGWVGRFVPQKDPETLVRALAQVLPGSPTAVAVLVGDGPLREEVRDKLDRSDLGSRVRWAGLRADARSLYPAFDVLMHVSRWEGQPRVVQEAVAERVPVVSTRASGVAEIIDEGHTGFVVDPGDAAGVAERTLAVLRSEIPVPLPDDRIAPLRERHGREVALRKHRRLYSTLLA